MPPIADAILENVRTNFGFATFLAFELGTGMGG